MRRPSAKLPLHALLHVNGRPRFQNFDAVRSRRTGSRCLRRATPSLRHPECRRGPRSRVRVELVCQQGDLPPWCQRAVDIDAHVGSTVDTGHFDPIVKRSGSECHIRVPGPQKYVLTDRAGCRTPGAGLRRGRWPDRAILRRSEWAVPEMPAAIGISMTKKNPTSRKNELVDPYCRPMTL
jgi:hypothetical protein